jgi:hypothetical protein
MVVADGPLGITQDGKIEICPDSTNFGDDECVENCRTDPFSDLFKVVI